jgi:hypothetical protein
MIAMARKRAQSFSDQRFHEDFNEAVGNILGVFRCENFWEKVPVAFFVVIW